MPENTQQNEPHPTVRKRNIMLILAAAAIVAGLCHACYTHAGNAAQPSAAEAPAEP